MERVSTFSRTVDNFAKKGQYFTDPLHAKKIGELFNWPENEISLLEPSIGDGKALSSFTGERNNCTIFGVELDKNIYDKHIEEKKVDYILNADFLSGITISNTAFSLCFANPPYGDSSYDERFESLFMKRVFNYIKPKGILVLIVPFYIFEKDVNFAKKFTNRYSLEAAYRFHDSEYKKYKQIVLIGRRKAVLADDPKGEEKLNIEVESIDRMKYLPMEYRGKKIDIYSSSSKAVKVFQTAFVDKNDMKLACQNSKLASKAKVLKKASVNQKLTPPIPPKEGHLYLLGTTGFTSGTIGSKEDNDLHLQRGKVNSKTVVEVETSESGSVLEKTKTIKTTSMVILQADGQIKRF